jgi:hypothetical protein
VKQLTYYWNMEERQYFLISLSKEFIYIT